MNGSQPSSHGRDGRIRLPPQGFGQGDVLADGRVVRSVRWADRAALKVLVTFQDGTAKALSGHRKWPVLRTADPAQHEREMRAYRAQAQAGRRPGPDALWDGERWDDPRWPEEEGSKGT